MSSLPAPIDPENIVYDFLYSKYDDYRSNLSPNTLLPVKTDIIWGSPKSELKPYAFMVNLMNTSRTMKFLGQTIVKYVGTVVARFAVTWIGSTTKPEVIKYFQEFVDYEITTNQLDTFFKSRGIDYVQPGSSTIVEPRDPEIDAWVLNFVIQVNYVRSF
jgi:hypothetical protein